MKTITYVVEKRTLMHDSSHSSVCPCYGAKPLIAFTGERAYELAEKFANKKNKELVAQNAIHKLRYGKHFFEDWEGNAILELYEVHSIYLTDEEYSDDTD